MVFGTRGLVISPPDWEWTSKSGLENRTPKRTLFAIPMGVQILLSEARLWSARATHRF